MLMDSWKFSGRHALMDSGFRHCLSVGVLSALRPDSRVQVTPSHHSLGKHLSCQLCGRLLTLQSKLWPLLKLVRLPLPAAMKQASKQHPSQHAEMVKLGCRCL